MVPLPFQSMEQDSSEIIRSTAQEALDYARGELEVLGKASRPVLLLRFPGGFGV